VGVLTLLLGAAAVILHFPGARWNVATFGVAILPALALGTVITGLGQRRA
jgi:type IV secretory pathway TrbD component